MFNCLYSVRNDLESSHEIDELERCLGNKKL
jgi:hypothetical protein